MADRFTLFFQSALLGFLQAEEDIAAYLNAIMEENDPALLAAAQGDIARARNMSRYHDPINKPIARPL